jgi:hypothetical protein
MLQGGDSFGIMCLILMRLREHGWLSGYAAPAQIVFSSFDVGFDVICFVSSEPWLSNMVHETCVVICLYFINQLVKCY